MKYNVIGDIHGRTCWKDLVISDGVNIFVGDYFSPYDKEYDYEHCKKNFLEIIEFKKQHPETVLLIGNHDEECWHFAEFIEGCVRYNHLEGKKKEIHDLFEANKQYFQMAYSINNEYLVSHAGVSAIWLWRTYNQVVYGMKPYELPLDYHRMDYPEAQKYKYFQTAYVNQEKYQAKLIEKQNSNINKDVDDDLRKLLERHYKEYENILAYWKGNWWQPKYKPNTNELLRKNGYIKFVKFELTPDEVAHVVNLLWRKEPILFSWKAGADRNDAWGNSVSQSPIWIRPPEVFEANIFKGTKYRQIVGHTRWWENEGIHTESWTKDDREIKEIVFTDCLQVTKKSFIFEAGEK